MNLKAAAVHESTHFIAGYLAGARITRIVCTGQNSECRMKHAGIWKNDINIFHPLAMQAVMIFLSGPRAEFKFIGRTDLNIALQDIHYARTLMKLKGWKESDKFTDEQFYKEFSGPAKQFVENTLRWKMICEFADHLRINRELSGQEAVRRILSESKKWSFADRRELFFPGDGLGGDQLLINEHGE